MTKTEEILIAMLTENTGQHFLDSGDAYGRNWQRNQHKDFMSSKPSTVEFDLYGDEICVRVCHDVFHWLNETVEYDWPMQKRFDNYVETQHPNAPWLDLMEDFTDYLRDEKGLEIGGIYGEGDAMTINTYNGEDCLSQVIQYRYFTIDGEEYALIQIHGGCDVRGGYTAPKAFRVKEELRLFDNARFGLFAGGNSWYSDDGYNVYTSEAEMDLDEAYKAGRLTLKDDKAFFDGEEIECYFY